jgi:hypothetical protein
VGKTGDANIIEANEKFEIMIAVTHSGTDIDGVGSAIIETGTLPTIDEVNSIGERFALQATW